MGWELCYHLTSQPRRPSLWRLALTVVWVTGYNLLYSGSRGMTRCHLKIHEAHVIESQ
ncbi:hypothetical protein CPB86DRAFT_788113 [Serendipita vermifera]|nr:hypothetical protein CPB86DRAFT_788113 [Serendipita vermifera]